MCRYAFQKRASRIVSKTEYISGSGASSEGTGVLVLLNQENLMTIGIFSIENIKAMHENRVPEKCKTSEELESF